MSLPKTKFRELLFQMLFRHSFGLPNPEEEVSFFMQALKTNKGQVIKAQQIVHHIESLKEHLDQKIKEVSVGFELERIQVVERNVLRLMIYECFEQKAISIEVAIAEAIRLVKKFSSEKAVSFVHALLDRLQKNQVHAL